MKLCSRTQPYHSVTKVLNETRASDEVSRSPPWWQQKRIGRQWCMRRQRQQQRMRRQWQPRHGCLEAHLSRAWEIRTFAQCQSLHWQLRRPGVFYSSPLVWGTMETDAIGAKARTTATLLILPPRTHVVLHQVYTQLHPCAEECIKSLIQWRCTNKLSADNVLVTVNPFAGSSAALQKLNLTCSRLRFHPRERWHSGADMRALVSHVQVEHLNTQLLNNLDH